MSTAEDGTTSTKSQPEYLIVKLERICAMRFLPYVEQPSGSGL